MCHNLTQFYNFNYIGSYYTKNISEENSAVLALLTSFIQLKKERAHDKFISAFLYDWVRLVQTEMYTLPSRARNLIQQLLHSPLLYSRCYNIGSKNNGQSFYKA